MLPQEFFNSLPAMIYHEDEPVAHPSSIPLYWVSKLASRHVKVVLTGEGADELFGGYEKYYQTLHNLRVDKALYSVLPRFTRTLVFKPIIDALPHNFPKRNKATRTSFYLDPSIESIFLDNYSTFSRSRLASLYSSRQQGQFDNSQDYQAYLHHFNRYEGKNLLSKLLYADMKTYLVELLMKQDQMSMAASIESRVPFLDHKLVEFAFTLPDSLKIKGFQTKRILRKAFAQEIPEPIMKRPKAGFPVPIKQWFANDYHQLAKSTILSPNSYCSENFNRDYIEHLFKFHRAGKVNYSDQIWTLLNVELWHKIFIQQVAPASIKLNPQ
jgi:asparagine synthase (glutamine-hydrolysing)